MCKQMNDVKLFILNSNTRGNFTVCKQMNTGLIKSVTYKLFVYKSYVSSGFGFK